MKPLIVLVCAFFISFVIVRFSAEQWNVQLSVRIGLAAMLLFTAIGHFAFSKGMTMMVPDFIPYKKGWVMLTGIFEVVAAIGLLIPETHVLIAWSLIIFFILILPVNIFAAIKHVNYQKGTLDGSGPGYLWFRIPLQILFISLAYFCTK